MKHLNLAIMAAGILSVAVIAGCASGPSFNQDSEASKSSIRAAEELGADNLPRASLYLQLSKEELARAEVLAGKDKKEQAASMLMRAEADAELAILLSREQSEKIESANALKRVRKLREDNQLPLE
ncbi:MAG: DUF4398 domain-containing protein [Thermodesulfobacteriota bacterium]|nr:DUF4398 domain-containing protein [Thermodesulfobacteriota bacterium]